MLHVGAEDAPTASTPGTSAEPWDVDLAKNALTEPDQVDEQMEPSSMKAKNQQCLARPNGPASRSMAMLCVCVCSGESLVHVAAVLKRLAQIKADWGCTFHIRTDELILAMDPPLKELEQKGCQMVHGRYR